MVNDLHVSGMYIEGVVPLLQYISAIYRIIESDCPGQSWVLCMYQEYLLVGYYL